MTTITIGSTVYDVYADIAYADTYLAASIHATSWASAVTLKKQQALITSTRTLDRQKWQGEKTDEGQPLAFPRTGISDLETDETPDELKQASVELALALVDGSAVQNDQSTANTVQSAGAGSARVSFFRGAEGAALRFPLIVQELIGKWLGGGRNTVGGFESFDVCNLATETEFEVGV